MLSVRARVGASLVLGVALTLFLLPGIVRSGSGRLEPAVEPARRSTARRGLVRPRPGLASQADFRAGAALARQPWVKAPSSTDARDGLGPLYEARSCLGCHVGGGRGTAADDDAPAGRVVRISRPTESAGHPPDPTSGPVPDPTYGLQLQTRSTDVRARFGVEGARIPAEVLLEWGRIEARVAGRWLPRPELAVRSWRYGPPAPDLQIGLRAAPSLLGLGALAAVPDRALLEAADPEDEDGDGISGRVNRVWDPEQGRRVVGRFGWKANSPTLRAQIASALSEDMGLTSPPRPSPPCTERQRACREEPSGGVPEVPEARFALLVAFVEGLDRPSPGRLPGDAAARGRRLFAEVGCAACHRPSLPTPNGPVFAFTDLLLHDLGPGLADGRPDFEASGSEWRTAPLWGIGENQALDRRVRLLHDGRARSVEEAILWHGGEAAESRARYLSRSPAERRRLIDYVRSR